MTDTSSKRRRSQQMSAAVTRVLIVIAVRWSERSALPRRASRPAPNCRGRARRRAAEARGGVGCGDRHCRVQEVVA